MSARCVRVAWWAGIFDTIGKFVKKKATKIVILNLSDIKPVPIGTAAGPSQVFPSHSFHHTIQVSPLAPAAVMAFLWDPQPFLASSPQEAEDRFITEWLTRQYPLY
jgi:hypothetical protein